MSDPFDALNPSDMDSTYQLSAEETAAAAARTAYEEEKTRRVEAPAPEGWEKPDDRVFSTTNYTLTISCFWNGYAYMAAYDFSSTTVPPEYSEAVLSLQVEDGAFVCRLFEQVCTHMNTAEYSGLTLQQKVEKARIEMEEQSQRVTRYHFPFVHRIVQVLRGAAHLIFTNEDQEEREGEQLSPFRPWTNLSQVLQVGELTKIVICDWREEAFYIGVCTLKDNREVEREEWLISDSIYDSALARTIFEAYVADPKMLIVKIEAAKNNRISKKP